MQQAIPAPQARAIKQAMDELGRQTVLADGTPIEACQCYYFSLNPLHVLFNDNCPEVLKENIRSIFRYYEIELPLG